MSYLLKRQHGLTLVELMVATTLSLILLAGVLLVFSANKTTYQMQTGLGTLQENGRYAMRQITADLQLAGFGGCNSPHLSPRVINLAQPSPPATDFLDSYAGGEFFGGVNDQTGTLTFGSVSMYTGPAGAGTDSIEIRGPLRSNVRYVAGEILSNNAVEVLGTGSGFANNEYLMIADCAGTDIFRATGVSESGGNTLVAHAASANTQANLSRRYGSDSVVMELATHTYFVGVTGRTNASGQAVTALYRFDGNSSQELVDGVEDLQVEYALDTDADGTVDAFANPGGVADWSEVLAVRISLLMNSVEGASAVEAPYTYFPASTVPISPATDDFRLRQEFSSLVSVRNSVL